MFESVGDTSPLLASSVINLNKKTEEVPKSNPLPTEGDANLSVKNNNESNASSSRHPWWDEQAEKINNNNASTSNLSKETKETPSNIETVKNSVYYNEPEFIYVLKLNIFNSCTIILQNFSNSN